eukprot:2987176-Rhodomonas_salina.1
MSKRMIEKRDVGAKISPNSCSYCRSPLAQSRALHLTNSLFGPSFSFYWNMDGSSVIPGGRSTISK